MKVGTHVVKNHQGLLSWRFCACPAAHLVLNLTPLSSILIPVQTSAAAVQRGMAGVAGEQAARAPEPLPQHGGRLVGLTGGAARV